MYRPRGYALSKTNIENVFEYKKFSLLTKTKACNVYSLVENAFPSILYLV
jgi:hypothetical protein